MSTRRHCSILCTVFGALLMTAASVVTAASSDSNTIYVKLTGDLLTLEAHDAPLSEVIHAIGEQAGFQTTLIGDLTNPVSMTFSELPLEQGLQQLVGNTDRFIIYSPEGQGSKKRAIVRLWLFETKVVAENEEPTHGETLLADDLQHPDATTRSLAVLKLAEGGATPEVLEMLELMLASDEDPLVRSRAAIALGSLSDEGAVPALESALDDEHTSVRIQATQALGQIDDESAALALGEILLESDDSRQRIVAVTGLWRQNTELAKSFLEAVADDPDEQIRAAALKPPESSSSVENKQDAKQAPQGVEKKAAGIIK